jgi:hypothetical protein
VAQVIAGRGGFALFRFGAGGLFGIGSVGCDLRFGGHGFGMLLRTRVSRGGCSGGGLNSG